MTAVHLLTQAEYAKHRGCSAVAVHKAIKSKRISLIEGRIDPVVADIQWAKNSRARAVAKAADVQTSALLDEPLPPAPEQPAPREDDYQASRARREKAEAAMAEMKLLEQQGVLVNAELVRKEFAAQVAAVRDALLQLPGRLAPQLIGEVDQARIQTTLDAEIRNLLAQLVGGAA